MEKSFLEKVEKFCLYQITRDSGRIKKEQKILGIEEHREWLDFWAKLFHTVKNIIK